MIYATHDRRERPVCPGCSIGRLDFTAGTVTAVVTKRFSPGVRYLLSCEHVLYPLHKQFPVPVSQPGNDDSGGLGEFDIVAKAIEPAGISLNDPNEIDAAIVRLLDDMQIQSRVLGTDYSVTSYAAITDSRSRPKVTMVGRTSGVQHGFVSATNATADLPQKSYGHMENVRFDGVAAATYESAPGDSGAPVILDATGELIGMHIGSKGKVRYFAHIDKVFDELQLALA